MVCKLPGSDKRQSPDKITSLYQRTQMGTILNQLHGETCIPYPCGTSHASLVKIGGNEGHFTRDAEAVFHPYLAYHCSGVTATSYLALPAHALKAVLVWSKLVGNEGLYCAVQLQSSVAPSRWGQSQSLKRWKNFILWRGCLLEKILLDFVVAEASTYTVHSSQCPVIRR
jgi:hypothetical protein